MTAAFGNHRARMERVLDYIDGRLDGDLDLQAVSSVAAWSKFHFHRRFKASFGLSVRRYVQLARMKRAARALLTRDRKRVTDVAMDAGYDAPDAFARAFHRQLGQSPSSFRKAPDWGAWLAAFAPLDHARSRLMQITFDNDDVAIRDVPPIPVAMLEHRGDRAGIPASRQRFLAWSKARGLAPETGRPSFMVFRSEREPAIPADYRMDLCVATDQVVEANEEGVKPGVIPGGRYAVLRYPGNTNNLEPAALYLYGEWLPASGEQAGDFPLFCKRWLSPIPEVAAHEVVTELFLPLR